jgi:hypothetical protein
MFVTDNDSLTNNWGRLDDHHRRGGNDYWRGCGYNNHRRWGDDYRCWRDAGNYRLNADGAIFSDDVMGAMVIAIPTAITVACEGISDIKREQQPGTNQSQKHFSIETLHDLLLLLTLFPCRSFSTIPKR